VILLASQGVADHSIAQQLALSRPTVIAIRSGFAKSGVEALVSRHRRKRSGKVLTAELEQKTLDTTLKTRPGGRRHALECPDDGPTAGNIADFGAPGQALDRTAPILALRPGLPERQTHDYRRHATTTRFAAFNILNGKVIGSCQPRRFALITNRMIRRGTFLSVQELERAVYRWLAGWNGEPTPFIWKPAPTSFLTNFGVIKN
jgi:hypothetical protein